MKIAVAATDELKKELSEQGLIPGTSIEWINELAMISDADVIIDLLFDTNPEERIALLLKCTRQIIIVNDVTGNIRTNTAHFIRINGWSSFLKRSVIEATCEDENLKEQSERVFAVFNKTTEWTDSTPGFITARVVSMIINEAYFALEENVSSKEEIDIAMKTGTNYPYGPFEWARIIGLKKIYFLLKKLQEINISYKPCVLLEKEANN